MAACHAAPVPQTKQHAAAMPTLRPAHPAASTRWAQQQGQVVADQLGLTPEAAQQELELPLGEDH
jgi:hypothetical protein